MKSSKAVLPFLPTGFVLVALAPSETESSSGGRRLDFGPVAGTCFFHLALLLRSEFGSSRPVPFLID